MSYCGNVLTQLTMVNNGPMQRPATWVGGRAMLGVLFMKKCFATVVALVLAGLAAAPVAAQTARAPTITVVPWLSPNALGSPSYSTWETNGIDALKTGGVVSTGTPGTPGYAFQQAAITRADMIVTGFSSWKATLHPETVFGAAYANELGTRPYFGLIVNGNGIQFSISGLGFTATSNDSADYFGFPVAAGDFGYGSDFVGVLKGADGQLFTSDDIYVTSGANSQLVDGLIGVGLGAADDPCSGNPHEGMCNTDAQRQAAIDDDLSQLYVGSPGQLQPDQLADAVQRHVHAGPGDRHGELFHQRAGARAGDVGDADPGLRLCRHLAPAPSVGTAAPGLNQP